MRVLFLSRWHCLSPSAPYREPFHTLEKETERTNVKAAVNVWGLAEGSAENCQILPKAMGQVFFESRNFHLCQG